MCNNNKDKTEILIIKNNKKEEKIEIGLRKGVTGTTEGYKYLGDHYNKGDNKERKKKRLEWGL